jgi:hypothetical protein
MTVIGTKLPNNLTRYIERSAYIGLFNHTR